jgi:DNA-binding transcriptional LysR family regulator
MEIRELRAFVAVVEEGGMSAAARRLHVSQSALSQTIQSLERQLGVQLLVRDYAGARPTTTGKALLEEARALLDHHDRVLAAISGSAVTEAKLRIGVPLEFPPDVLPAALAELATAHPATRVEVRHSSSAAQLTALRERELDLVLVRYRPADLALDAVLAVIEAMGVIIAAALSAEIAGPGGVELHRLSSLAWIGFPRSDGPAWHDQVTAILRGHGIDTPNSDDEGPVTSEVKLAAVGTGRAFALASPTWAQPLPEGIRWHPLVGDPIIRRTWAVWHADSRRRDLATLVAALDVTGG